MKPIKSIEEELADCRQAFAEHPDAKTVWCCHHEVLVEELTDPFEARISYILSDKPEEERAVRFRNFRPVKDEVTIAKTMEDVEATKAQAWKDYNIAKAQARKDVEATKAQALEVFEAAIAQPREVYDAATAKAREVYDAATAQAREDYHTATAKAKEDYKTALAKAGKEYDAASAEAWEVYKTAYKLAEKPSVDLLNQEWPDHTWNGKSIFNNAT